MTNRIIGLVLGVSLMAVGCGHPAGQSAQNPPKSAPSFAAFLAIDGIVSSIAPTPDCNEQCQKLRQEFRYVVYVGRQIYCYWELKKAETATDFDQLATQLEQSITTATSVTDYYLVLRRWASSFHDGHVNAMLKDDHSDIENYTAPMRLEVLAPATDHEKVIIVENKSHEALKVGDVVTAIDGVPIRQVLDRAELQTSGSTARMRRFFAARRLVDVMGAARAGQPLELTIASDKGEQKFTIERMVEIAAKPETPASEPKESTGAELIKALVLPGNIGYLRIDGFSGSQSFFLLEQAMQRLSATKGLLIDLRKNGGGDQSGNSIIAQLIKNPVTRYRTSERMSDYTLATRPEYYFLAWTAGAPYADWHDLTVKPKDGSTYAGKPVVALTSPNCFSACDTFTAGLKANGLATVVGEGTGGGTGTPLVFDLPHSGNHFRYSVVRGLTARGDAIEGQGTLPDVVIEPTAEDRVAGKDKQLARALEILGSRLQGSGVKPALAAGLVTATFQPVWKQDFSLSPTFSDEHELRELANHDEL